MTVTKFVVRIIVPTVVLWSALIGFAVQLGQVMRNPELAYLSSDGETTAIHVLDLNTGINWTIPGTDSVSFFAWSPDGQQIAFITGGIGTDPLYLMSVDGRNKRQLAQVEYGYIVKSPWSPDSQKLVFPSKHAGKLQLYVIGIEGNQPQPLTSDSALHSFPTWSPDGQYIAYLSREEKQLVIQVISTAGKQANVFKDIYNVYFAWSPQGRYLAFDRRDGLYLANVVEGTETRISATPGKKSSPSWSPDGTKLAFVVTDASYYGDIYVMNTDGSDQKQLVANLAVQSGVALSWSTDGKTIAFSAMFHDDPYIYVVDVASGKVRQLTFTDRVDWFPSWRP